MALKFITKSGHTEYRGSWTSRLL